MYDVFSHVEPFPKSKNRIKDGLKHIWQTVCTGCSIPVELEVNLITADKLFALVRLWGIPALIFFFLANSSSLPCNFPCAGISPSTLCVLIYLSFSEMALLLCNICCELISSRPDNGSGPGVIITGYCGHSFQLQFHVRQS